MLYRTLWVKMEGIIIMNRNSIRKATKCCLTAAVVLTGSSFVSHAAVSAGAGDLISAATEAPADNNKKADKAAENNNATAGVTEIFANSLAPRQEAINTGAAQEEAEAPVKTEYDDIVNLCDCDIRIFGRDHRRLIFTYLLSRCRSRLGSRLIARRKIVGYGERSSC